MAEQTSITVSRGDVLIDHMLASRVDTALAKGISVYQHPVYTGLDSWAIDSVAQLVESIVIHEGLVIPTPTYKPQLDIGSGYRSISQHLHVEITNIDELFKIINKHKELNSSLEYLRRH